MTILPPPSPCPYRTICFLSTDSKKIPISKIKQNMHHFFLPFVTLLTQLALFPLCYFQRNNNFSFVCALYATRRLPSLQLCKQPEWNKRKEKSIIHIYFIHLVRNFKRKCFTFGVNSSILALFMRNFGISFESYFIMNMFIVLLLGCLLSGCFFLFSFVRFGIWFAVFVRKNKSVHKERILLVFFFLLSPLCCYCCFCWCRFG